MLANNLRERYSPMYFLAALGAGGLSVSFFIYPMFLLPHPDTPMVTFNHIWPVLTSGASPLVSALLGLDLLAILAFAVVHVWLLAWNLREFKCVFRTKGASDSDPNPPPFPIQNHHRCAGCGLLKG